MGLYISNAFFYVAGGKGGGEGGAYFREGEAIFVGTNTRGKS